MTDLSEHEIKRLKLLSSLNEKQIEALEAIAHLDADRLERITRTLTDGYGINAKHDPLKDLQALLSKTDTHVEMADRYSSLTKGTALIFKIILALSAGMTVLYNFSDKFKSLFHFAK